MLDLLFSCSTSCNKKFILYLLLSLLLMINVDGQHQRQLKKITTVLFRGGVRLLSSLFSCDLKVHFIRPLSKSTVRSTSRKILVS